MGTFIQPFDFKTLFVDYFLGSMQLFIFGFIIIFSLACARFQMGNRLYLTLLAVSLILISIVTGTSAIYLLVICLVGIVAFNALRKMFS